MSKNTTAALLSRVPEAVQERALLIPIFTKRNVAALIGAREASVSAWTRGTAPAIGRGLKSGRSPLVIPFTGLLEAEVLQHLEGSGISRRKSQTLVRGMREEHGPLAFTEYRLVTDGKDVFVQSGVELMRTLDSQMAHYDVLKSFLARLSFDREGRAVQYAPDRMPFASVHPLFNGGALSLTESKVPVFAIVGSLRGGEVPAAVADDYRVPLDHVQAIAHDLDWAEAAS